MKEEFAADGMISVIVPVYQAEKYLPACLKSILAQSYQTLEVILIDDGSTDGSGAICDNAAKTDERVRVVHRKNQGASAARNAGLELCSGEFVLFVDADDWIERDCCEKAIEEIERTGSDILFFEMCIDRGGNQRETAALDAFAQGGARAKRDLLCAAIPYKDCDSEDNILFYGPFCKLFRRGTIRAVRFPPGLKYGEDALFNLRAIQNGENFCFLHQKFYHYRKNESSVTAVFRPDRAEQSVLRLRYTKELICSDDALQFLMPEFRMMYINLSFSVLENLFMGRRLPVSEAWKRFRSFSQDPDMRAMWKRIRTDLPERIRILDGMFTGSLTLVFLCFLRLRYMSGNGT